MLVPKAIQGLCCASKDYNKMNSMLKSSLFRFSVCMFVMFNVVIGTNAAIKDEAEAKQFMEDLNKRFSAECNHEMVARWDYIVDVEDPDKEQAANDAAVRYLGFQGEAAKNCSQFDYENFVDDELYREFRFLSNQGAGALESEDLSQYKQLQANMETIYSTATICDFYNPSECDLKLEPDIEYIMATSRDWDQLKSTWEQWRDVTGKLMRTDFQDFVELSNKAATLDGFSDTGEYWLNSYTVTPREADAVSVNSLDQQQFRDMVDSVWSEVSEKLYKKLHAYVRMKLAAAYPDKIDLTAPLPSHILGNMWAQDWVNIGNLVMPFPEFPSFDVTESMHNNGWDIDRMFKAAEEFFTSITLETLNQNFWDKSVINQTAWGKTMVCHASAEDFCTGDDWRIKMCTDVDMTDLVTVHHEMGHIEFFMEYKDLPYVFREAANPGFHEALGDLIALSVSTPMHMENILGLTPSMPPAKTEQKSAKVESEYLRKMNFTDAQKKDLNFIMRMALEKVSFLPFGYLIDKFRWEVFDGTLKDDLNAGWWRLREEVQGVIPPDGASRGEENFDPGAKYHVPANVPYIRYFVSFIAQFQFHKTLCAAAGHNGLLYNCDIFGNENAGQLLKSAMQKGFSEPWPAVLRELGGSADLDPSAIIEYFAPLMSVIDEELAEAGQCIGWGDDCETNPNTEDSSIEEAARKAMEEMDRDMTIAAQTAIEAQWEYYNDMTDENQDAMDQADTDYSVLYNQNWKKVVEPNLEVFESFDDDLLKRQFLLQKSLGTAALSEEDTVQLNKLVSSITDKYGNKVCNDEKRGCKDANKKDGVSIDELEVIFAQKNEDSDDFETLDYYWRKWRDVTGKEMKEDFIKYVKLMNKAAEANNFANAGEMWLNPYTVDGNYTADSFKEEMAGIWEGLRDLYKKLYGFVRWKLHQYNDDYKEEVGVKKKHHLPAHLLGNMWAQSWENIYDKVAPFPEEELIDLSDVLSQQVNDTEEMFAYAENFFVSLGLESMVDDFWDHSTFDDDDSKNIMCHASAWDFLDTKDIKDSRYRIKMCTNKNQEDFIVLHHEMGHIEYQMLYSHDEHDKVRPSILRDGANPGFHEAIGDTISLSVSTPDYLKIINDSLNGVESSRADSQTKDISPTNDNGDDYTPEEKQFINFLMKNALSKVAFLPYAYILDEWRWEVFSKDILPDKYNRKWWDKRVKIQGIRPPATRYVKNDFDIASKYHVATNVPYIRYFVATILQFQFHKTLCEEAGELDDGQPLAKCSIYNSKPAGKKLRKMLALGATQPWTKQLEDFTGGGIDESALLEYFQPLSDYLDEIIEKEGFSCDWADDNDAVDQYLMEEIPPVVPIVVGCVLAAMVLVVIVAYFVGSSRQKKKRKENTPESIEM